MPRHRGLMLVALMLPTVLAAWPARNTEGAAAPQITGVWACEVTRPGSTVDRPLVFVFHSDGTMAYSSQTTVNGGPLGLPFTSRGGGNGEWQKVGPNDFAFQARENMYINGNAGGFFYVEAAERLDKQTGRLCSGTTDCPGTETKLRLTQFTFAADGSITGEVDLLPAGSRAESTCQRLTFPSLP